MGESYKHPLCKDLTVTQTNNEAVIEDLVIREAAPVEPFIKEKAHPPSFTPKQAEDKKDRQLSAYMTHELRAPLTSIRSALSIMEIQLGSRLAPEEAQILKMAMRNSDRLNSLINDIMDFSKVQAGKMSVEKEALRPEELMQEALDSLRSWAVTKGIRLSRIESEEPLPHVEGDRKRTIEVLTNLLSNAIKFTPQGGKIEISARLGGYDHAGTVAFRVQDSGPGIPADERDTIFRTFEQSALGKKSGNGTGLGLTLSKAMVELMGGRIWAESWKGLGAAFHFTLPIHQKDHARSIRPYPKRIRYHGLLVNITRRLNAVVAALFA